MKSNGRSSPATSRGMTTSSLNMPTRLVRGPHASIRPMQRRRRCRASSRPVTAPARRQERWSIIHPPIVPVSHGRNVATIRRRICHGQLPLLKCPRVIILVPESFRKDNGALSAPVSQSRHAVLHARLNCAQFICSAQFSKSTESAPIPWPIYFLRAQW